MYFCIIISTFDWLEHTLIKWIHTYYLYSLPCPVTSEHVFHVIVASDFAMGFDIWVLIRAQVDSLYRGVYINILLLLLINRVQYQLAWHCTAQLSASFVPTWPLERKMAMRWEEIRMSPKYWRKPNFLTHLQPLVNHSLLKAYWNISMYFFTFYFVKESNDWPSFFCHHL